MPEISIPYNPDKTLAEQFGEAILQPFKYDSREVYVYVARRMWCDCPVAAHPQGYDTKSTSKVLAEWVKLGLAIDTVPRDDVYLRPCRHTPPDAFDSADFVYAAEQICGCVVGVQPVGHKDNRPGNAKVIQVWGEEGFFVHTLRMSDIHLNPICPHRRPPEKQEMLPGLMSP
jgi:hypothetical protein